jgi:hypothetical protein
MRSRRAYNRSPCFLGWSRKALAAWDKLREDFGGPEGDDADYIDPSPPRRQGRLSRWLATHRRLTRRRRASLAKDHLTHCSSVEVSGSRSPASTSARATNAVSPSSGTLDNGSAILQHRYRHDVARFADRWLRATGITRSCIVFACGGDRRVEVFYVISMPPGSGHCTNTSSTPEGSHR